jgi:hypothetical protein
MMVCHNVPAATDMVASSASPGAIAVTAQVRLHMRVRLKVGCSALCQTLAATPGSSFGHIELDGCLYDRTD